MHDHPEHFAGTYLRSHYANAPSIEIFDRSPVVLHGPAVSLLATSRLGLFLDHYGIILPF